jgi:predicted acyltransferase
MAENLLNNSSNQRYLSLDVLRGLTVALMIVVNSPGNWGAIYAPFKHAEWHGFTITDLVFPTFLFVVGNALSFGIKKLKDAGDAVFLKKIIKRTAVIFIIGLFLNYFPFIQYQEGEYVLKDPSNLRIWGVLQRIAVCYFFGSLIAYYLNTLGSIIISAVLLLGYWAILFYGGASGDPYSLNGNLAGQVDLLLLETKNIYKGFGIPFDPEGLLSTIPSIVNVVLGFLAGNFIRKSGNKMSTVIKLTTVGVIMLIVAQIWNPVFPINKPIWTSSFVLYTVGWDLILISALMFIIEIFSIKKWAYFFEVFGKNPLFIFVLSGMLIKVIYLIRIGGTPLGSIIYNNLFTSWLADKNASLLFAIVYMLILWLIGYIMDKKKIYVKV